uniref:Uncharacterized protein n=1 Tax=Panagrolaimus sp. ES5 TaxID=591445 RepID=A0AC34GSC4_9BILA
MVHIVEIKSSSNIRHGSGKDDSTKRKITHALEFSIFIQFSFGFMVSLMGLSGLPADLIFAGKMFGLGLGQTFCSIPGIMALNYKCNRIWIGYIFLQAAISLCQLSWFIVCVAEKPIHGWLAALYFCLFAFQMWCAIAAILHTKITSFQIFITELRKKRDKSCSNVKPAKKTKSMSSVSSKKLGSTTSSIKSKPEKKTVAISTTDTKKKQNVKDEKKATSKSEQKTDEKTKILSSQQKPDLIASTSKAEKSNVKEMMAPIPEAKTPPTITARRPRYYFIEHATDLESEVSDESPAKVPLNVDKKSSTTTVTVQKSIPSKPKMQQQQKQGEKVKGATPPIAVDRTQQNSLLSSQATQNSSKSSAMNSSTTTKITEKLVTPSPQPPKTTTATSAAAAAVPTTTTTTTSSVAKSIQGALASPLNIINHQLLNKTL